MFCGRKREKGGSPVRGAMSRKKARREREREKQHPRLMTLQPKEPVRTGPRRERDRRGTPERERERPTAEEIERRESG